MPSRVIESGEQDQVLLLRFRQGDRAAFSTLVARYQKPIYNAAYRLLGNADDAYVHKLRERFVTARRLLELHPSGS